MNVWAKLVGAFLGAPAEQIAEYFKEKQRLKQELEKAKLEGRIAIIRARAEARAAKEAHTANWEMASLQNSGWKDEFVLLLISIPVPLSFVPGMAPYIKAGFDVLATTPYWYMALVLAVYLAVYGIRWKGAESIKLPGAP